MDIWPAGLQWQHDVGSRAPFAACRMCERIDPDDIWKEGPRNEAFNWFPSFGAAAWGGGRMFLGLRRSFCRQPRSGIAVSSIKSGCPVPKTRSVDSCPDGRARDARQGTL